MINKIIALAFLYLLFLSSSLTAQSVTIPDTSEISKMSLEDIMKYKSAGIPSEMQVQNSTAIEVASVTPLSLRRFPGVISVITAKEIQMSGARDLMDILKMVPGFDFAVDVEGVVGIAMRGNWANEGMVMLRVDGMSMNETVFGTLQFANNFPIDQIKKIEIIRGPGSAIYGGDAEYGVINIITKSIEDINGVQVNAVYGKMKHALESNNYTVAVGRQLKDFNFTLTGFAGVSNRSDQVYKDIFGNTYDMSKNSQIKPLFFNLGINYKELSVRAIYDHSQYETRDGYDHSYSQSYLQNFTKYKVEVQYKWKLSDKLLVIPEISFRRNSPWEVTSTDLDSTEASDVIYKTVSDRYKFSLKSQLDLSKKINITLGLECFDEVAIKDDGEVFRNSNASKVNYINSAVFVQGLIKNKIANVTLGARYDYNNSFGHDFVPRIGLTKRLGITNFKLLYSNSFKAPYIENVETSLSGTIKPEKTQVWEFESSLEINSDMFLRLNFYDITTYDKIIYTVDTSADVTGAPDGYINRNVTGTQGVELEYKFLGKWGTLDLTYSYYTAENKPHIPEYDIPDIQNEVLALAHHKITLNSTINLSKSVFISPSLLFYSKKYGIAGIDELENYIYKEFPETFYANVFIGYNTPIKGLQAGFGVYDIFNQKTFYIQPYNSGHAPFPGTSREFLVRLNYNFKLK
ncbi:MAG: TonB-dependent receptor [Bacteroidota bacterium]